MVLFISKFIYIFVSDFYGKDKLFGLAKQTFGLFLTLIKFIINSYFK